MTPPLKRVSGSMVLFALVLSAALMPIPRVSAAAEEIPHENFDLVNTDLSVVITLLNSSIRYSERALMCMYNQSMTYTEQNLSAVWNILVPAQRLLERIADVASSYENLSALIPPFADLSGLMDDFADDERALIATRGELVIAAALENLTGEALIKAIEAIKRFNSLIIRMNSTIDDMLVAAQEISDLVVEDKKPFSDNQLIPLIEKLRELLVMIETDINRIIDQELPFEESEPFLILWLSAPGYYLGDSIIGGGYLFFNGAFAPGYAVMVALDSSFLLSAATSAGGRFSFSYEIPLNGSWVGTHRMSANCTTPVGLLTSDALSFWISLIPTVMTLSMSATVMSIEESVTGTVLLKDFRGNPIASSACTLTVDGASTTIQTGTDGRTARTWQGDQLGYGRHSFSAAYGGEVPYAPSVTSTREVVVDIPTVLDLRLFSDEVRLGQYIVGNGTLYANGTERLPNQMITMTLDGVVVANVTTGADGEFAFTISSESLTAGGHTLKAALIDRDPIWRYSQDEEHFVIKSTKIGDYPFWPIIPGWGGGGGDLIPYLFIGANAYLFWLLLLVFVGVIIRVLQMRRHLTRAAAAARSEELEPLDSATRATGEMAVPAEADFELPQPTEGPSNPNERIVWYYQRLLAFLMRRGWPGLRGSMTHREVAKTLKAWGYPQEPVEDATMLFERAMYSGAVMTDEDAVHMSAAMTSLVRPGKRGVPGAV